MRPGRRALVAWALVGAGVLVGAGFPLLLRWLAPERAARASHAAFAPQLRSAVALSLYVGDQPLRRDTWSVPLLLPGSDPGVMPEPGRDPWGEPWRLDCSRAATPDALRTRGPDRRDGGGDDVVLPLSTTAAFGDRLLASTRGLLVLLSIAAAWLVGAPPARAPRSPRARVELLRTLHLAVVPWACGVAALAQPWTEEPLASLQAFLLIPSTTAGAGTLALAAVSLAVVVRRGRPPEQEEDAPPPGGP